MIFSKKLTPSLLINLPLYSSRRPISFALSQKQQEIKKNASKLAKEVLQSVSLYDRTKEFPVDMIKKAQSSGLMNSLIPKEYGGQGLDVLSHALISEAIGYECTSMGFAILGNDLATIPIINAGSDEIKKKYLRRLIEEPVLASYCVSEYDVGQNVSRLKTKTVMEDDEWETRTEAVKKGGEWVIKGSEFWVVTGGVASMFIVLARTELNLNAPIEESFTAFVVDGNSKGLSRGKKRMGQRCINAQRITFRDVVVPSTNIIGSIGDGMKIARMTFDKIGPAKSAFAIGLASRALDETKNCSIEGKAKTDPNVIFTYFSEACSHFHVLTLFTREYVWSSSHFFRVSFFRAGPSESFSGQNSMLDSIFRTGPQTLLEKTSSSEFLSRA
ncbi:unnamed protein product [Meloidogyne enterolobii]|uniref:Uncharacterized protein n=1 Tax=Meloidogyne enterolobii TaxID=390850 RepID=A0ACB1AUQ1_MELEN